MSLSDVASGSSFDRLSRLGQGELERQRHEVGLAWPTFVPCALMIDRQIDTPIPMPPDLAV